MSNRPYTDPKQVITDGAMASNIASLVTILQQKTMSSYGVSWSGTSPVGTLSVQVSNDYSLYPNGQVNNPGTWTTLVLNVAGTPSSTIAVSGNTGTVFVDITDTAAYAIQLVYTAGSGTGTMQATYVGKVQ